MKKHTEIPLKLITCALNMHMRTHTHKCICTHLKMHTHSQKVMYTTHLSCIMLKESNNASGSYGWSFWYMMTSLLGLGAVVRLVSGKVS